jgi:hypothetical protein
VFRSWWDHQTTIVPLTGTPDASPSRSALGRAKQALAPSSNRQTPWRRRCRPRMDLVSTAVSPPVETQADGHDQNRHGALAPPRSAPPFSAAVANAWLPPLGRTGCPIRPLFRQAQGGNRRKMTKLRPDPRPRPCGRRLSQLPPVPSHDATSRSGWTIAASAQGAGSSGPATAALHGISKPVRPASRDGSDTTVARTYPAIPPMSPNHPKASQRQDGTRYATTCTRRCPPSLKPDFALAALHRPSSLASARHRSDQSFTAFTYRWNGRAGYQISP